MSFHGDSLRQQIGESRKMTFDGIDYFSYCLMEYFNISWRFIWDNGYCHAWFATLDNIYSQAIEKKPIIIIVISDCSSVLMTQVDNPHSSFVIISITVRNNTISRSYLSFNQGRRQNSSTAQCPKVVFSSRTGELPKAIS